MSSFPERLQEIKKQIQETIVDQVNAKLPQAKKEFALLDVREKNEWDEGHLPGAVHVPRGYLELRIEETVPDKDTPVVLYCAGGVRSALAAKTLQDMGYTHVESMAGGFTRWKDAGYKFVQPRSLDAEQKRRYSRHLLVPEVGEAGQLKLLDSKVLLLGAGGLGSPAALYLTAAGIGTIGIVDSDVVDESNLQRQVVHRTDAVGTLKTESARKTMNELNPGVNVITYNERLDISNIERILDGYDIVLDGADNFDTRYVLNDFCVARGIPVVHGSIFRFEGQLTAFIPFEGPCYRCLYPESPPPDLAPT